MKRETYLKVAYTVGAVILGGLIATHVIPASLSGYADGMQVYLVMHSFMPSAKTGAPQG